MTLNRLARMLLDIISNKMPVRCGLLLVPSAAVERIKSKGTGQPILSSILVGHPVIGTLHQEQDAMLPAAG